MNYPEFASKQQESIIQLYVAHFVEKKSILLIFVPFYWFDKKELFKQIKIFL